MIKKVLFAVFVSVFAGVALFGASVASGATPSANPPSGLASPTFSGLTVENNILLKKGTLVVGSDWTSGGGIQTASIDFRGGSITNSLPGYPWIDFNSSLYLKSPGNLRIDGSIVRMDPAKPVFIADDLAIIEKLIIRPSGSDSSEVYTNDDPTLIARIDGDGLDINAKEINLGNVLSIIRDGNVGIGTSTPGEKLEVNGNVKVSGNVSTGTINTDSISAYGTHSSITFDSMPIFTKGASFTLQPSFPDPLQLNQLNVLQGLSNTSTSDLGRVLIDDPDGLRVKGPVVVSGAISNYDLTGVDVNDSLSVSGKITANNGLAVTGATTLNNGLTVSGVATLGGNVVVTGKITATDIGTFVTRTNTNDKCATTTTLTDSVSCLSYEKIVSCGVGGGLSNASIANVYISGNACTVLATNTQSNQGGMTCIRPVARCWSQSN